MRSEAYDTHSIKMTEREAEESKRFEMMRAQHGEAIVVVEQRDR